MGERITLHGRSFERHPSPFREKCSEQARYARLAVALAYARRHCSTVDRALYLSLTRAHAEVLATVERLKPGTGAEELRLPWESAEVERLVSQGDPCSGSA